MIDIDIALERPGFSLNVAFTCDGGVTALFGRSGSGKSSVLNAVAGLLRPRRGHIRIEDESLFDSARGIFVPPHRRRIGLVFQDAQLFPHLSVEHNLVYGRWFQRRQPNRLDFRSVIEVLDIGHLLARRPGALSGGEKQRVAIGRALLASPRLLLMDEPLASLDAARKHEILALIERVRDEMGVPIFYVSHAMEEVARLAGQIVVIEAGRVERSGTPREILALPRMAQSPLEGQLEAISLLTAYAGGYDEHYRLSTLEHPAGRISIPGRAGPVGTAVRVIVHGNDISLALRRPEDISIRTILAGTVRAISADDGPVARVDIVLAGGDTLSALVTRSAVDALALRPESPVFAMIKAAAIDSR